MAKATIAEIRSAILRALSKDGTAIGNQSLREHIANALGAKVEKDDYFEARNALIEKGKLEAGGGRGGSVRRVVETDTPAVAKHRAATSSSKRPPTNTTAPIHTQAASQRTGVVKKSDLYASIWASCDELRGGMDPGQYKDYVLFMLFIKYVSDKYGDDKQFKPAVVIPKGASFKDMIALKGKDGIGEKINTQIIQPLIDNNVRLARSDFPDFNDPNKLGEGDAMVKRLTNLIAIFQKPELDFSRNRADNDDILGDAYEYLMRHFASVSGKTKGQFYTPSEVSRIMAKVIGIAPENARGSTTAYDPTCGSGSLLLKVAAQAGRHITLEGQEKDVTTAGLARMNMILHGFPEANILQGDTLVAPKFKDKQQLRTYDYVVANPPFSDKAWSTGLVPSADLYQRFVWGEPPKKQGDYAYLLHIVRSMKSTGKGAVILPHGVLFRGNVEAVIRQQLVRSGMLKAIIGLPANLFYGTGIPACILVLDKENASARKGVFMIDAAKGFIKDGPKNRLREQDIHKIVDAFQRQADVPRYARMVSFAEIDKKNDFNLNLPRYIDSSESNDLQDIQGHLRGGIPLRDIDAMNRYWRVMPKLRAALFKPAKHDGYCELSLPVAEVKPVIFAHPQFTSFKTGADALFAQWVSAHRPEMLGFAEGGKPKVLIDTLSETLLTAFSSAPLLDAYDIYQHLMDQWVESMQDDAYLIAADGWSLAAQPRLIVEDKKDKQDSQAKSKQKADFKVGKASYRTYLLPPALVIVRYFAEEQAAIDALETEVATLQQQLEELAEEHSCEDGALADAHNDKDKLTRASVKARLAQLQDEDAEAAEPEDIAVLEQWLALSDRETETGTRSRIAQARLMQQVLQRYAALSEDDVKALVVDDKWLATLAAAVQGELDRVSQTLTGRVRELAERYATPLPQLVKEAEELGSRIDEFFQQVAMRKLLGGDVRLPGFSGDWEERRLGDCAQIVTGKRNNEEKVEDGKYPFFVRSESIERINSYSYDCEAILVPGEGRIGDIFHYYNGRFDVHQRVYAITRFKFDVHARFVYFYMLNSFGEWAMQNTVKATVDSLRLPTFKNFKLLIPPTIEEQVAIAEMLSDIDADLLVLNKTHRKIFALKQGMLQELLTGKTRLIA